MNQQTELHAGFADPVFASQEVFRAVLDAMARPGRIVDFPAGTPAVGEASAETLAVLLALADNTTPVWLPEPLRTEEVRQHLAFHTGAPTTDDPSRADFAVVDATTDAETIDRFAIGTPEYPDRSVTLILPCESLTGEGGWTLSGPGIETSTRFGAAPLPAGVERALRRNAAIFPLGLDAVFTAPGRIAAIPRSTGLED